MTNQRIKGIITIVLLLFFMSSGVQAQTELRTYFELGQKALSGGRLKEAIKYFEQVVDLEPNFAPAYNYLGLAHGRLGEDISDVMWYFNVAIEIDPKYFEAYNSMCRIYYDIGKFDEAEISCLNSLSINPDQGSTQLSLAWIYLLGKQQPAKAAYYFKRVMKSAGENSNLYFGLGMAYVMNGDYAEALDVITTLRSKGDEETAAKLENQLRQTSIPQVPDNYVDMPERQRGTLVESGGPQPVAAPPSNQSSGQQPVVGANGLMRIRLQGRLTGPQPNP